MMANTMLTRYILHVRDNGCGAAAGVSVVMSAGNSGPNPSTIQNPYPYVIAVAASKHSRQTFAIVQANGERYVGSGFYVKAVGPARLLLADAAALTSTNVSDAQKCFNASLDPSKVAGTIVVSVDWKLFGF
jgi:hypothetical protein